MEVSLVEVSLQNIPSCESLLKVLGGTSGELAERSPGIQS